MGILDELEGLQAQARKPCVFALFLETLPVEDRREVEVALADPEFRSRSIHQVLRGRGWVHVETVLSRHRRGDCCCGNL